MDMCCHCHHDKEIDELIDVKDTPVYVHMISGSFSGVMEHVSIFPFDTIKTHMQSSSESLSIRDTVHGLYSSGGFSRFWRGVYVIALASIPAHAGYFSAYEYAKKTLGVDKVGYQFISTALTGAFAALFHDLILTPCDVVKQRMQLSGSKKYFETIGAIAQKEGMFAFYRSLPITLLMNGPYTISTVVLNENIKKLVQPKKRKNRFLSYFLCAAVAGINLDYSGSAASVITLPLDNIKTKLQTQSLVSSCRKVGSSTPKEVYHQCTVDNNVKYKDILTTAKIIYNESGFASGFMRGMMPRILCSAPSCAISWGTYEIMKHGMTLKFPGQKAKV